VIAKKNQISNQGVRLKTVFITELNDGDDLLNEPFLLEDVIRRETKDGRPYLLSTFRDKTGQIGGVFWDVPEDVDRWVRPGLVTLVTGRVNNYKSTLQIQATDLNPHMTTDMSELLPSSHRQTEEMVAELQEVVQDLNQPWQELVSSILLEKGVLEKFATAPAARTMHHAYVGGLMEHTLSMVSLARFLTQHYPYVNKDLLLAGTLLHDMGKIIEYTTEGPFSFSDDGRLVGHIVRAIVIVETAAAKLKNFPEDDLRQLIHLIASHHGTNEWGSPIVPKTLEAILLHQIDLLDSRVQGFFDHLRNDSGSEVWSTKPSYMFKTELRRPPGFK
jgi:3'-5' exoribonuclease